MFVFFRAVTSITVNGTLCSLPQYYLISRPACLGFAGGILFH